VRDLKYKKEIMIQSRVRNHEDSSQIASALSQAAPKVLARNYHKENLKQMK
jgi:hypothetical protein